MIHVYSIAIELQYDDEDGEFDKPSIKEIERSIGATIQPLLQHMGFDKDVHIEAGKGTISDVFGF
jgi:hypothetical protein